MALVGQVAEMDGNVWLKYGKQLLNVEHVKMLPFLMSDIPMLTTIVSLFILVSVVERSKFTCLCDLQSGIGDKSWPITKDGSG